jgi:hypothetical protein
VLAPLGFVIANLIVLFAGWTTDWKMFAAMAIGLALLALSRLTRPAEERVHLDWGTSVWLWPWLLGLLVLSLLSSFSGGRDDLHFGADMAVTAAFSLIIYFFALSCRSSPAEVKERIETTAD